MHQFCIQLSSEKTRLFLLLSVFSSCSLTLTRSLCLPRKWHSRFPPFSSSASSTRYSICAQEILRKWLATQYTIQKYPRADFCGFLRGNRRGVIQQRLFHVFLHFMNTDEDIRHTSLRLRYKFSKISFSVISSCNILVAHTEFRNKFFLYLMNTDEDIRHTSRRLRYKFQKISFSIISSCNILVVHTEFSNELFLYLLDIDEDIWHTPPCLR